MKDVKYKWTMTLGQLIDAVSSVPEYWDAGDEEHPVTVVYDFCGCVPDGIHSWRGWYSQLAIGWADGSDKVMTVSTFLSMLKGAVDQTFTGWKGGDYRMKMDTPVMVDNPSDFTETAIVAVRIREGCEVVLCTHANP